MSKLRQRRVYPELNMHLAPMYFDFFSKEAKLIYCRQLIRTIPPWSAFEAPSVSVLVARAHAIGCSSLLCGVIPHGPAYDLVSVLLASFALSFQTLV